MRLAFKSVTLGDHVPSTLSMPRIEGLTQKPVGLGIICLISCLINLPRDSMSLLPTSVSPGSGSELTMLYCT